MNTVMADRLIDILNKEAALYEDILKLSKNKTDIIVAGKVAELDNITKLEQSMILTIGKLEEERERLIEEIEAELGLKTRQHGSGSVISGSERQSGPERFDGGKSRRNDLKRRDENPGKVDAKASGITLSVLEKHFPKERAEKLRSCREKLSGVIKELGEANNLNSKLIKNSLDYIEFSINLLTGTGDTGNTYGHSGRPGASKKRNLFDVKL